MPDQDPSASLRGPEQLLDQRAAIAEMALRPSGVLGEVARQLVTSPELLHTATDVADVVLPTHGHGEVPRYELIADDDNQFKAERNRLCKTPEHAERILRTADQLGLRQPETLPAAQTDAIDPSRAVVLVAGAANRTHLVRRAVVDEAMQRVVGAEAAEGYVRYEIHGQRTISMYAYDDAGQAKLVNGEPQLHPEYKTVKELAPDFLPDGDVTELDCKLAVRKQQGWRVVNDSQDGPDSDAQRFARIIALQRGDEKTVLIQPLMPQAGDPKTDGRYEDNFEAGLTVVDWLLRIQDGDGLRGKQVVVGENGQYRTTRELSVALWGLRHNMPVDSVILGDEAGFSVRHLGKEYVTAPRGSEVYAQEFVTIYRMNLKRRQLRGYEDSRPESTELLPGSGWSYDPVTRMHTDPDGIEFHDE